MQSITSNLHQNKKTIDKFFQSIFFKKQYIRQLKKKIALLDTAKKNNYKVLNTILPENRNYSHKIPEACYVRYTLTFSFSKTNTIMHVVDCSGNSKFFYSAGLIGFKGKQKTLQSRAILKKFYRILIEELAFLRNSPIAIHFKNKSANYNIFWFLNLLLKQNKFFIIFVKFFTLFPYNGCRKKKLRRKKFKTMKRKRRYG